MIEQFRTRKEEYTDADDYREKRKIEGEIERLRVEIARTLHHLPEPQSPAKLILARNAVEPLRGKVSDAVKRGDKASAEANQKKLDALLADISKWEAEQTIDHYDTGDIFDWSVEFAEVFEDGGFDVVVANPPYVRQEEIRELKRALREIYSTYAGTADLYVYFYERGWQLLKTGGALAFITQNKFFRAAYGENLRRFLSTKTELTQVIDFGDAPIFDATAYPCIVMCIKTDPRIDNSMQALKWRTKDSISEFAAEFRTRSFPVAQAEFTADGWRLESPEVLTLLKKLRNSGTPLGEYVGGKIYRGIITGLNEAFVIDRSTRDRLIAEDAKSAEILKPFLRGRDVKRWRVVSQDRWLIATFPGLKLKIEDYPAIQRHLQIFRKRLEPTGEKDPVTGKSTSRKIGSQKWFEIQDPIAYWREFEKPKIIYPNICKRNEFAFEENAFFSNQKTYIIPRDDKSLLGILNSSVFLWLFDCLLPKLQGDFYEPNKVVMQEFPIPSCDDRTATEIERLTNLVFQENEMMDRVTALECEIDRLVYKLYDLTADEIAIIEGR